MRYSRKRTTKHQQKEIVYKVNEQIRVPEVRVIDDEGNMLGVMPTRQAISMAREKDLTLVEVSPKAQPPVTRLMNYGKLQYQKNRQAQKQRAQQKKTETKGIKMSVRIGRNDLNIRKEQAKKFLNEGHKVKIELNLRGREKQHKMLAAEILKNFVEEVRAEVEELAVEQPVQYKGNGFITIINKKP